MDLAPKLRLYPDLPRELTDHIITYLIHLYDDQPAYQWIRLRHITRYHKDYLEMYFLRFWIPKLSFTISEYSWKVKYTARKIKNRPMTNTVRLKPRDGWEEIDPELRLLYWEDIVMQTTYPIGEERMRQKRLIIRLGEGYLHKGYTQGGLFSDTIVSELELDPNGDGDIIFNWKLFFTTLFREEMLMEIFRARKLSGFLPTLRFTKPEKIRMATHRFLQEHCQTQQRQLLTYFRDHIAAPDHGPFSLNPYLNLSRAEPNLAPSNTFPVILNVIHEEESVIFYMPGWETWNVREIARLRVQEEKKRENLFPCEAVINETYPSSSKRWDCMSGNKIVGEDTLTDYLTKGVWADM